MKRNTHRCSALYTCSISWAKQHCPTQVSWGSGPIYISKETITSGWAACSTLDTNSRNSPPTACFSACRLESIPASTSSSGEVSLAVRRQQPTLQGLSRYASCWACLRLESHLDLLCLPLNGTLRLNKPRESVLGSVSMALLRSLVALLHLALPEASLGIAQRSPAGKSCL